MTSAVETVPVRRHKPGALSRTWAFARRHTLTLFALLAFAYLLIPIAVVVVFSFNDPIGRFNVPWQGFTLDNWAHPLDYPDLGSAVRLSIEIALFSSIVATAIGTLMALALVRYQFRGQGATNLLIFLPMATPEVVMGSSLLTLFVNQASPFKLGFWTIAIAHVMFDISFVVVTVKARLQGLDPRLEQAAMDLYATPLQTLRRVTLPLVMPGIVAAALLAFALSFDDFIITDFNAGSVVTFPMFVYGAHQRGVPPQINVIGSLTFFLALAFTAIGQLGRGRSAKKHA